MFMKSTLIWATTILACSIHTAFAAQTVYKCKSAQGIPQYVALPISGQQCQKVRVDGRLPPSAVAASRAAASPAPATDGKTPPKVKEMGTEGGRKLSAQECNQVKQVNETLATGQRVYEVDEKGERRSLDENTRLERQKQYQDMAKGCE